MKTSYVLGLILLPVMILSTACSNKKADDSVGMASRGTARTSGISPNYQAQPGYNPKVGRITVGSQYTNEFTAAVKDLLSPTLGAESIGTVSPLDGVKMQGKVAVDPYGNIIANMSSITITVSDSYTGLIDSQGRKIEPVVISLPGYSGTVMNGQLNLVFRDNLGEIRITGTFGYGGGAINSKVGFTNYNNTSRSFLGDFQIDTCSFFGCQ